MLDENKNYWLYIAPHVYCRIEGSEAILYNTKNGQIIKTNDAENIDLPYQSTKYTDNVGAATRILTRHRKPIC